MGLSFSLANFSRRFFENIFCVKHLKGFDKRQITVAQHRGEKFFSSSTTPMFNNLENLPFQNEKHKVSVGWMDSFRTEEDEREFESKFLILLMKANSNPDPDP